MKKRLCCFMLSVLLLLHCTACFSDSDPQTDADTAMDAVLERIVLDKDLVEIARLGSVVKIDSIEAGLDTYSFDTVLLDTQTKEILCEVSFDEGAWVSGLTENGFYAVDTVKKELCLYDRQGNVTKRMTVSNDGAIPFCALSENGRYFLYSDHTGTQATVIYLSDDGKKSIELKASPRDPLSFKDNLLRFVSIDGGVFALDVKTALCTLLLADKSLKLFSSDYCLGETESNFLWTNENGDRYIPLSSANEIVIGMGENGFATSSALQDTNRLRFYDVNKKTVAYYDTTEAVEKICFMGDGTVLAVTGSSMEKQHKLTLLKPASFETLTVLSQDVSVHTEPALPPSPEASEPPEKLIEGVGVIAQFPAYPTGCESVTAVMALHYLGIDVTVESFITEFLPTCRDFYIENGKTFGPSPYECFIGNPKSSASYGCMAPVIEKAVLACIGDSGTVENITGMPLEKICERYIDNDIPVLLWATVNMLETNPKNSWYLSDGSRFTWPGNEHCMLLVGYDDSHYYFNDPYAGKTVCYEKALTADRYAELGSQALVVYKQ